MSVTTSPFTITPDFKSGDELHFRFSYSTKYNWDYLDKQKHSSLLAVLLAPLKAIIGDWSSNAKEGTEQLTLDWIIRIEEETPTNERNMSATFKSIKYDDQAFNDEHFDSSKPSASCQIIKDYWDAWIDQSVHFEVTNNGSVLGFTGMEKIRQRVESKIDINECQDNLKEKLDNSYIEYYFKQLFSYYPFKPATVGDTWQKVIESTGDTGFIETIRSHATYSVTDITEISNRKVATISFSTNVETVLNNGDGITSPRLKILDPEKGTGTICLELETGFLISAEEECIGTDIVTYPPEGNEEQTQVKTKTVNHQKIIQNQKS